jgi:TolB protein
VLSSFPRKKLFLAVFLGSALTLSAQTLGPLESYSDVGDTPKKGSVEYNADAGEYRITGGGANMWASTDAFHFVWKQLSGDVTLTADVHFIGTGAEDHRKAALIIRQSLEPDSAYADVARHGDGLTSLQYRLTAHAITEEVRSPVNGPVRIRLERHGDQFIMYAGSPGDDLKPSGPVTVVLHDPVYAGLAVCSHDANILETAVFSNVKIETAK